MGTEKKLENNETPSIESLQASLTEANELLAIAEAEKKATITERDKALAGKKLAEDRLVETEKSLDETKRQADEYISKQQESFRAHLEREKAPVNADSNPDLIPMFKGAQRIEVHPSAVGGHVEAGWKR